MTWHKWYGGPARRSGPRGQRAPLSRRAFLGGGAAVLTLPWLESLRPARAATAAAPVRLVFWYLPCGMVMDEWRPRADGALGDLGRVLQPLDPLKQELLVLSNLANRSADVSTAGDHARGTGSFLTAMECEHTAGANIVNGISIDQVVANAIGDQTLFRSLELGTTGGSAVGECDSGYSCAYSHNISWLDASTPAPKLTDPALVFDRLFAGFDTTRTAEEVVRRKAWRTSVLDNVLEDANQLHPRLSVSDRAKLDEFMTGVRALEERLQVDQGECIPGQRPQSGLDFPATIRAMSDLTVLAFECDVTRVVTFMMENAASGRSFDFIGVRGSHHELSHHQGSSSNLESLTQIDAWEMAELGYLLGRLEQTVDVDGSSLLHNSLAMASSEISDGDRHNHDDLPVLLAGRGGGAVVPGRHKAFATEQPIADLFIAMADAAGVRLPSFGQDGTQPLDLS